MDARKGVIIQQVSEFGASDQNVARTTLQLIELTKVTELSKPNKEALFHAVNDISHRLASAQAAAVDLKQKVDAQIASIQAGEHVQDGGALELPFVPSLQILFEGYYYNLKNVIRDLGGIPMRILYGKRFEDASAWFSFNKAKEPDVSKHLRHMEAKHAGYSTVRELIDRNEHNFEHVVTIRNALEHPGGKAGTVRVRNWSTIGQEIVPPHFLFEEVPGEIFDVVSDMLSTHEAVLTLVETVLVFGLMFYMPPFMGVQFIAQENRDPEQPMAYRAVFLPPDADARSKPFTGKAEE